MGKLAHRFHYIAKSKFVRSVFLRVLSIFLVVSIAIVVIVFFSFASELNKSIITEKQKQLGVIESSISKRMDEISSIAFHISADSSFHLAPIEGERYTGYEMSNTLTRYLVGNGFIEHLAYYRLSEPDVIYTSKGELSFLDFWRGYIGLDKATAERSIQEILSTTRANIVSLALGEGKPAYFGYTCPLPLFSQSPEAFVLMLIPQSQVAPLLETQISDSYGKISVYDADGSEIFQLSNMKEDIPISLSELPEAGKEAYTSVNGMRYILQKQVSESNGWIYVSALRMNDIISGLANRQLAFIILLLVLMFVAIFAMLICIIVQFKPISSLAAAVTDKAADGAEHRIIDERALLSSTFAALKGDSEQKQRFETAYHEADAASKAKSAFLSSMSHDIRTPMNAIIGMSALARKHADEPEYVRECLQKVEVASKYLLDIINNVLDMSRIESGRFSLAEEVISLPEMASGLMTILNQSVEAKRQRLIIEGKDILHERVIGDSLRLMQVFMNILSNSIKFTPAGGTISLRMRENETAEAGCGDYVFTFSDTGIGMAPEFVEHVFDTFSRAKDETVAKTEGTGLGMAIVKNLVEMMGGTIRCESELGKGTVFTVALRMRLAGEESGAPTAHGYESYPLDAPEASKPADESVPRLEGMRVLVAEDNEINREIVRKILKETGAEIVEAANGSVAVEAFREHPEGYFSVILMDLQMPEMNGYEAAAAIRAMQRADAATLPIYALTASTFEEDVRRVKEAGMNGYIGKPYTPETLYRLLKQVYKQRA